MAPQRGTGSGAEAELPEYSGQYRLEACLGSGGMGVVHLATSTSGLRLAVKVVHAEFAKDPEFRGRFRQEVAAARQVSGAFTAPVVDADTDSPRPWMATLFIPGPTLSEHVKRNGPMPPGQLRRLMAGLAEALRDIHRAGVVHRDLKPSNVLLAEDGPKVIDFGISRPKDSELRTETGKLIGTPPFMAPEQFRRPREVGPAADIFALGSVTVHAATGRGPFDSDSPYVVAYQVVHDEPDLTGVPPNLAPLVRACLAKEPEDRPTADELMRELRSVAASYDTQSFIPSQREREREREREKERQGAGWTAVPAPGPTADPGPGPGPGPTADRDGDDYGDAYGDKYRGEYNGEYRDTNPGRGVDENAGAEEAAGTASGTGTGTGTGTNTGTGTGTGVGAGPGVGAGRRVPGQARDDGLGSGGDRVGGRLRRRALLVAGSVVLVAGGGFGSAQMWGGGGGAAPTPQASRAAAAAPALEAWATKPAAKNRTAPQCSYGAGKLLCAQPGLVSALDPADGSVLWRHTVEGAGALSTGVPPVESGGLVQVLAGRSRQVQALDPDSGRVRWERDVSAYAAQRYVGGTLLLTSADGTVTGVDSATGDTVWSRRIPGQPEAYFTSFDGDRSAYVASVTGKGAAARTRVTAVDPETGDVRWDARLDGQLEPVGTTRDGSLFFSAIGGSYPDTVAVVRYDPGTRQTVRVELPVRLEQAHAVVRGDVVYLLSGASGALVAVDMKARAQVWRTETGVTRGSAPVAGERYVYFTSSDGRLLAVDVGKGRPSGQTASRLGDPELITSARPEPVVIDGRVCAGTLDGTVLGLDGNDPASW
ncbi:Serine/threonine protein kinase [Streptomyces sp. cf124]|uniref:serine/threonine-protein kinase n=1 Tax=Streptomyces sp. cf124 TaxID=1761903 RepID=UPI0008E2937D|nr:serine/threonine-protein kinase [Streptomyces sp. cf124]SFN90018.1 Serine/threonine protein kinase [Streptomyces sp. cf124]